MIYFYTFQFPFGIWVVEEGEAKKMGEWRKSEALANGKEEQKEMRLASSLKLGSLGRQEGELMLAS